MYRFNIQPFLSDIWEIWQWKNSSENKNHTQIQTTLKKKKSANILHIFFVCFTWKYFIRNADLLYKCNHVNINHIAKFHTTFGTFWCISFLFCVFFLDSFFFRFWLTDCVTRVNNLFWVCSMSTNKIIFSEEFSDCVIFLLILYVCRFTGECALFLFPFFSAFLFISRVR